MVEEGRRTRKYRYNFSEDEAQDIYASACGHIGVMLQNLILYCQKFLLSESNLTLHKAYTNFISKRQME